MTQNSHLEAKAIVSTTAMQIAASCAMMSMATVAPLVAADLGVPASLIGSYIGLIYAGSAVSAPTCGGYLARYGAIRVTQVALLFVCIGLLFGCWHLLAAVGLGAFLLGIGYGLMTPASSDLLSRYVPNSRIGLVFSIKQTGVPLGFALAGVLTPFIAETKGWETAMYVMAGFCITFSLLSSVFRRELDSYADSSVRPSKKSVFSSLLLVIHSRKLRHITLVCFVYNGMQLCVLSFLVSYFFEERGTELLFAGLVLSVANVGGMFGRPFWGWFSDAFLNPRHVLAGLGLTAAVALLVLTELPKDAPTWSLLLFAGIIGATSIGWNGVALALMARSAPKGQAGTATGGILFFSFFGSVLFPSIFMFVERLTGSYAAGYMTMAVFNILIGLFLICGKEEKS